MCLHGLSWYHYGLMWTLQYAYGVFMVQIWILLMPSKSVFIGFFPCDGWYSLHCFEPCVAYLLIAYYVSTDGRVFCNFHVRHNFYA